MLRYLFQTATAGAALSLAIAAINVAVDPFGIWRRLGDRGAEISLANYSIYPQYFRALALKPDVVFVGASRTHIGLNPGHAAVAGLRPYNLGMPGQQAGVSISLLSSAGLAGHARMTLWGLDFEVFGCDFPVSSGADVAARGNWGHVPLLLEIGTLSAAYDLLQSAYLGTTLPVRILPNGQFMFAPKYVADSGGHRILAITSERMYLNDVFGPRASVVCDKESAAKALARFRSALSRAHQSMSSLYLVISPFHARHIEVLRNGGQSALWEDWKRAVVRINVEEAARANAQPFPLWDFSGYTELTTEPFPPLGDTDARMRWHWESSHYKTELGDLMLDRMFNYQHSDRTVPADFGVLLTPENIEAHLAWINAGRERWAARFPEDVREIAELAQSAGIPQTARTATAASVH